MKDNRKYKFGAIWEIPDKEIKFPRDLFRTYHNSRIVVIIEFSELNFNKDEEFILIAPLSSDTSQHHNLDILVKSNTENRLNFDSYIRMRAIQFIPKSLLKNYIGKLDNNTKCDVLATINSYFNYGQV